MRKTKVICVAVTLLLFLQGAATAEWKGVEKCYWLYGHVWNTDDGTATGNGDVPWCAPTATINSFRYLEQRYPAHYGNSLTGDDIVAARNALKDAMKAENGATAQDMWEGKVTYLDTFAPDVTKYSGMVGEDPSTWNFGNYLTEGYPTWEFLFTELAACEDVEIWISNDDDVEHIVTLTSLTFDDTNGNDQWDTGEARKIDYLDPNNPTRLIWADLRLEAGKLSFLWDNGLPGNPPREVYIYLAYSESVPEPATLSLLALGCLAVLRRRSKIRRGGKS